MVLNQESDSCEGWFMLTAEEQEEEEAMLLAQRQAASEAAAAASAAVEFSLEEAKKEATSVKVLKTQRPVYSIVVETVTEEDSSEFSTEESSPTATFDEATAEKPIEMFENTSADTSNISNSAQKSSSAPSIVDGQKEKKTLLQKVKAGEPKQKTHSTSQDNQGERASSSPSLPPTSSSQQPPRLSRFLGSIRRIGDAVREIDQKHHYRRKTRNSIKKFGAGLSIVAKALDEVSTQIEKDTQRGTQRISEVDNFFNSIDGNAKAIQAAVAARTASQKPVKVAMTAGKKPKAVNEENKVTNFLAAAAVIGGGILLAKGNNKAGATALATGGAVYMAGEASRAAAYRHDDGLNQNLHLR